MPSPPPRSRVRSPRRAAFAALLTALAPLTAPVAAQPPAPSAAPRLARPTLRALVGGAAGTAFARDENGTSVRPGLSPLVGVEAASAAGERTAITLSLRASRPRAAVEFDAGGDVEAGAVTMLDLTLGVELRLRPAVAVRGGIGLLYLDGPSTIAPFRFNNASRVRPLLDLGAALRASARLPLHLALGWQGFQYGAATAADPIREAGLVQRVVVGVRYGR